MLASGAIGNQASYGSKGQDHGKGGPFTAGERCCTDGEQRDCHDRPQGDPESDNPLTDLLSSRGPRVHD